MTGQYTLTHLHRETNLWFTLGKCEQCGGPVQEANGIKVHSNHHDDLINDGILEWKGPPPPEISVKEDGETDCDGCAKDRPCPFCGSIDLAHNTWDLESGEVDAIECAECCSGAIATVWNGKREGENQ